MREAEMFEPMQELLGSKGYEILLVNKGRKSGPDIIAQRHGRQLIMEMKGDTAALDVDLGTGIFQLLRHIHEGSNEEYALGLSNAYIRLVCKVEYPLKKLGIQVFILNE